MRALILAAGLGVRMQPLSLLRPKPALPVLGLPVIGYLFELLAANGVEEVMVNLHHRADQMRETAEQCCPSQLELHFSNESEPLGTGGGIRRVSSFLRDSDPALVLAGDMLLDSDLAGFARRHRERGDAATLLLRSDERIAEFGPIGIDGEGAVRRIGNDFDLGGALRHGLFVGVRAFAPRCFDSLPDRDGPFEDLRDWLAPALRAGARDIRAECYDSDAVGWEPIGTPAEYLRANLEFDARFDRAGARERAPETRVTPGLVVGRGARLEPGARLEHAVVWDGETVPSEIDACGGVFAGGRFVATDSGAGEPA
ncbi:MAG: NDP-sugar synthase [Myxococcota bacterium]|nr:NDP-sugar synthase [Myxococcota bacterium]